MSPCVVSFATSRGWYLRGQERLRSSLKAQGYQGAFLGLNQYPVGCLSHQQNPYAFKVYALYEAVRQGHDLVIWLDASCWAIRPLESMIEEVERSGYLLFTCGWSVGQWCTDHALRILGTSREEAFKISLVIGGCVCLYLKDERSLKFLRLWKEAADRGTFVGQWTNKNRLVSEDPRVLGHRHDQPAASIISYKLGMKSTYCPKFFSYCTPVPDPETVIVTQGM